MAGLAHRYINRLPNTGMACRTRGKPYLCVLRQTQSVTKWRTWSLQWTQIVYPGPGTCMVALSTCMAWGSVQKLHWAPGGWDCRVTHFRCNSLTRHRSNKAKQVEGGFFCSQKYNLSLAQYTASLGRSVRAIAIFQKGIARGRLLNMHSLL